MDIAGYTESSSEGEHENDFSLFGNMSRYASYPSPSTESVSNGSNQSVVNQSLVRELSFVKGRLEEERDKLKEWEGRLRGREERLLCLERTAWEAHKNLSNIASSEVAKRWSELEENQDRVLSELRGDLKERGHENTRLKNSFNYVRQGNDVLRQQVADLKGRNEKLEREISSLQGRITSLKRQRTDPAQTASNFNLPVHDAGLEREATRSLQAVTSREIKKKQATQLQPYTDSLFITLSWLTDTILSAQTPELIPQKLSLRVTRLLTSLSELMHCFSSLSGNHELVLIRFCYWSIYHYRREQDIPGPSSSSSACLSVTMRRIGEECVSAGAIANKGTNFKRKLDAPGLFLQSSNLEVRLLSCVVVLQTISQADTCSHVYDLLRNELREVRSRDIMLAYRVIDVLLTHFTSQNRLLLANSIQTLLLLIVDQTHSSLQFSINLCNDHFFRSASQLITDERLDQSLKEKLAVILQRLSKLPHSLKVFERSGLEHSCEELLRRLDPRQTFIKLNTESVLANLALARHNS